MFDIPSNNSDRVLQIPPEFFTAESPLRFDPASQPLPCNGHSEFCSRPYNRMVFPATHNSYSALLDNFSGLVANQRSGIRQQLEEGIRVLLLDVHEDGGLTALCHGLCMLGNRSHLEALYEIRDFLDTHPREVLTILYEDHVPPPAIEADIINSGLIEDVYAHSAGAPWPTLGEMIEHGTRLVVMAKNEGGHPAWYHRL